MEQQYLWELTVSKNIIENKAEAKLTKIPVEEKAKSYKVLNGCAVYRQFIRKDEILEVFTRSYYAPTIYGAKEEDIPKMYHELKRVLGLKLVQLDREADAIKNLFNAIQDLEEGKKDA